MNKEDIIKLIKEILDEEQQGYIVLGYERRRTANDVFRIFDNIERKIRERV